MLVIIAEFSVRNTQEKMHVDKGSVEEGGESADITTPPTELQTTDPRQNLQFFSSYNRQRGNI